MYGAKVESLEDLRSRVKNGHVEYVVLLGGGLAYSRKTIRWTKGRWHVKHHIDGSKEYLTDEELWTKTNIGTALDNGALVMG